MNERKFKIKCIVYWGFFFAPLLSLPFFFHRIPLCKLINQHLSALANKFPDVKFLKSVSSVCIPNYPDKNLPTIFVYYEGDLKKQYVGPLVFGGMNFKQDGKKNQSTDGESTDCS